MLSYLLFLFLAKDGVAKVLDVLVKSLSGAVSVRKTVCKKQKKKGEKSLLCSSNEVFFFLDRTNEKVGCCSLPHTHGIKERGEKKREKKLRNIK